MSNKQAYKELVKVLNYREPERSTPSPIFINPEALNCRFKEGHVYQVQVKDMTRKDKWESECLFRYERQSGIHYVFREVRGGWTRTYTEQQLIGRKVKEVGDEPA